MKIVKEAMHTNEDSGRKKKLARCNSNLSNDGASEDVMTSYAKIIIR